MAQVFLSYSRKDSEFVRTLYDALSGRNHTAWVDWEGIPPSAEWFKEVRAAIESADAFVFIISPDSVSSKICTEELAHAGENHKRLIPVVCRDVVAQLIPEALKKFNYVFFRSSDTFTLSVAALVEAIDTDLDWVHMHTRVLVRAKDWDSHNRDTSFLLRGMDLQDAVQWLGGVKLGKNPPPTDLHVAYIEAGRKHESEEVQRLQDLYEKTLARQLGAQAELMRNQRAALLPRSILLAAEAMRRVPSAEAYHALLSGVILLPRLVASVDGVRAPLVFSPTGDYVAAATTKPTVRIIDAATGHALSEWPQDWMVTSLAISPDGRYVVAASRYGSARVARIWDVHEHREIASVSHSHVVNAMAFSTDGRYLATASTDQTAVLWEVPTWREARSFRHNAGVDVVAFSTDRPWLATASSLTAQIWDIERGELMMRVEHLAAVQALAFSPDANYLATASVDRTVGIWTVDGGHELARLPIGSAQTAMAFERGITAVAFSPDGLFLATASWDRTARIWEIATRRESFRVTHEDGVSSVLFTSDGRHLVTASDDGTARVWDVATGTEFLRTAHEGHLESIALSPDNRFLASVADAGTAAIHDIHARRTLVELRHREPIGEVSFSPSGEYIATSSWYEGARIWHADREDDARRLTDETPASSFAFSPDGAHFATAGGETISIRNTESWRPVRRLMHKDQLREVLFSPDSRLVAGVTSSAVQIWELASESQTVNMPVGAEVVRVAFSPDGRFLVTTSRDNVARLWEVSTGGEGSPRVVRLHNPVFVQPGRQIPCYGGKRS